MTVMVEWNSKAVVDAIDKEVDKVERQLAKLVERRAEALAPKLTGRLRSEIDVRSSKFKGGGYIVQAQGPGNYSRYYASFVELGTSTTGAQPYLRPAIKRYEAIGMVMLKRAIG